MIAAAQPLVHVVIVAMVTIIFIIQSVVSLSTWKHLTVCIHNDLPNYF